MYLLRPFTLFAMVLLAVMLLAQTLPTHFGDSMPQVPGEDVLQVVLGDVRQEVSKRMVEKADNYFHGGVTHHHCDALETGHAGVTHAHEETESHTEDQHAGHLSGGHKGLPALWQWMNQHVHEQHHRHLQEDHFQELMPWIWAACRASPDNIQAWLIGAYVLHRQSGDAEACIKLLKQGMSANPKSPELAFEIGKVYYNQLEAFDAAESWFETARTLGREKLRQGDEDARLLQISSLHYLGVLAHKQFDFKRLATILEEAETINSKHAITQSLRRLMQSQEK